nr:VanW family protein [Pontibacillus chungwhensis]
MDMKMALLSLSLLFGGGMGVADESSLSILHKGEELERVRVGEFVHVVGKPFMNLEAIQELSSEINEQVGKPPVNAKVGESGEIVPGKSGSKLYEEKFRVELIKALYHPDQKKLSIPMMTVHPKVDSELIAHIRTQQIGQYVTYFNSSNEERTHNIKLSSDAIDNHVVFPNEVFSFNEVVGKRTKDKGYKPAPVIVKGEVTEGIGGGICQVSSTLFNAVDHARVKVVERYSHSKQVPYVPPGRDATVSWWGPDFTFKNNYNEPLLIRSNVTGGTLRIVIYSANGVDVKPRDIPDASRELPDEIHIDDLGGWKNE